MGSPTSNSALDILSLFDLSLSNLVNRGLDQAFSRVMSRRTNSARNLLLEELAKGSIPENSVIDEDEWVAITYRYCRAAMEGTARLNLRLLAKCLKSDLEGAHLSADRFLYYAEIISSLNRSEIHLITALLKERQHTNAEDYFCDAHVLRAYQAACKSLVPDFLSTSLHVKTAAAALTRHGLVLPRAGFSGDTIYGLSPLIDDLLQLPEFVDAMSKEGIRNIIEERSK